MYKVELMGNYNIYVSDMNYEFTPIKPMKTFSDVEFESSNDIKKFLDKYLKYSKVEKAEKVVVKNVIADDKVIHELPKVEKVEEVVINATDASKTSSANAVKNEKTLADEKAVTDETIIDATNASTKSAKKVEETAKAEEPTKVAIEDKTASKKAGRPKKK